MGKLFDKKIDEGIIPGGFMNKLREIWISLDVGGLRPIILFTLLGYLLIGFLLIN